MKAEAEAQSHAGLVIVAESHKPWSAVRDELTAWAGLDERNSIPHQRLGFALFHLGKVMEAFQEYQAAAKLNREFIAETALAKLYTESGDRENATRFMNAAVKRLPDNMIVRCVLRGQDLRALGTNGQCLDRVVEGVGHEAHVCLSTGSRAVARATGRRRTHDRARDCRGRAAQRAVTPASNLV